MTIRPSGRRSVPLAAHQEPGLLGRPGRPPIRSAHSSAAGCRAKAPSSARPVQHYSLCSTWAGGVRVAVSPGSAAITAAAASQPAAMMDSAASGTATTGVVPS